MSYEVVTSSIILILSIIGAVSAFIIAKAVERNDFSDIQSTFKWGIDFTIYILCGAYSIIKLLTLLVRYRGIGV